MKQSSSSHGIIQQALEVWGQQSSGHRLTCRQQREKYQVLAYAYLVIRGDETSDNFVSRVQDNLQITDRRAGLVSQRAGLVSFGPWYLSDEKYQGCKNPKKSVQSTGHSQNQRGQVTQVLRKPW